MNVIQPLLSRKTKVDPFYQDLQPATQDLRVENARSSQVLFECGHRYAYLFDVNFFGQVHHRDQKQVRARHHCGRCMMDLIKRYFRRCSCCGFVIMPDQKVSLSPTAIEPYCSSPWNTKLVPQEQPGDYLACMRPECTRYARMPAGYWRKEGFVPLTREESGILDLGDCLVPDRLVV